MPQMGESVMEGEVLEWLKQVGDTVEVDEPLLEIATDKVDTEVPSPEGGVLLEILVESGQTVEVGQPIAIIGTEGEEPGESSGGGAKAAESAEAEEPEAEEEAPEEEETEPVAEENAEDDSQNDADGERVEVVMPQMGESVMEGEVLEWLKQVGDTVDVDEPLLEIATDKVDTEVPSPEAGTLVEILVEAGDTVEVGQPIAIIATGKAASGDAKPAPKKEEKSAAANNGTQKKEEPAQKEPAAAPVSGGTEPQRVGKDGRFFSPLVRSIAREEGISQEELDQLEGSGKDGRVSKEDILAYVKNRKTGTVPASKESELEKPVSKPSASTGSKGKISAGELNVKRPHENVEIIKMDRMRKMIAEHMVRSKQVSAHVSTFSEVDVTNIVKWRNANKNKFQEQTGVRLTFTPIFIEAFIQAIGDFPLINCSVDGENIIVKKDINFGIAVALGDGGKGGLIVPVIKQAQNKNLAGLAKEVNDLAGKARNKELNPDDLVGGTITLTNYGSVGNLMGTPIINQPQVAILGTGVIEKRPVVLETDAGDVIAIRHMMYLSMSYDHRIIDGAHGGAFTTRVKELLEGFDPNRAF